MENLILDIESAVIYSLFLLIFCIIAYVRLKKGKSFWEYYITGVILQFLALAGNFKSSYRSTILRSSTIMEIVFSTVIAVVFLVVLIRHPKHPRAGNLNIIDNLASATADSVYSFSRRHKCSYINRSKITEADCVIFAYFMIRALIISSIPDKETAHTFSNEYTIRFKGYAGNRYRFSGAHDFTYIFNSRTSFYDRIICSTSDQSKNNTTATEEFSYIIHLDISEGKFVEYNEDSPIPLISFFDMAECDGELAKFLDIVPTMAESYLKTYSRKK